MPRRYDSDRNGGDRATDEFRSSGRPSPEARSLADEAKAALAARGAPDSDRPALAGLIPDGPTPDVIDVVAEGVTAVASGFVAVFLFLAAIVVAIPIFAVTSLVFVAVDGAFHPEGTLAALLAIVWFIGTLVLFGIVLMRLARWAPTLFARL